MKIKALLLAALAAGVLMFSGIAPLAPSAAASPTCKEC